MNHCITQNFWQNSRLMIAILSNFSFFFLLACLHWKVWCQEVRRELMWMNFYVFQIYFYLLIYWFIDLLIYLFIASRKSIIFFIQSFPLDCIQILWMNCLNCLTKYNVLWFNLMIDLIWNMQKKSFLEKNESSLCFLEHIKDTFRSIIVGNTLLSNFYVTETIYLGLRGSFKLKYLVFKRFILLSCQCGGKCWEFWGVGV